MPTLFSLSCTHCGAGPFFTPRISRPAKIGQACSVLRREIQRDCLGTGKFARHRRHFFGLQRAQASGGQIARDAPDAGRIAAIGGDGDIDQRIVGQRPSVFQRRRHGRAAWRRRVQLDDAVMVFAQQQLAGAEHIMPRDSTPRMVPIFSASPVAGITVPGRASTTLMPARALGAPQTICSVFAVAGIDHAQPQLVGIGMFFGGDDFADDEILQPRAGIVDAFHFQPDGGQLVGDGVAHRHRCRDVLSARRG